MHEQSNIIKLAAAAVLFAGALASGNTMAGQGIVNFSATINTSEFLLPVASCETMVNPPMGGIGSGAGTTNLFTKNPTTDLTTVVLASFDCVTPNATNSSIAFRSGKFTLTGAGGDTIVASYYGVLNFNLNTGFYEFDRGQTIFNIEGGTGRYARATGGGNIGGTELLGPGGTSKGVLNAVGQITY